MASPGPKDGGADAGFAAHRRFGVPARAKSSVPPWASEASRTHGFSYDAPFRVRPCTYRAARHARGAVTSTSPPARWIVVFGNSGLPNASTSVPGTTG